MMSVNQKPSTQAEKQNKPQAGETPPETAFSKARIYAANEAARLKGKGAKFIR